MGSSVALRFQRYIVLGNHPLRDEPKYTYFLNTVTYYNIYETEHYSNCQKSVPFRSLPTEASRTAEGAILIILKAFLAKWSLKIEAV